MKWFYLALPSLIFLGGCVSSFTSDSHVADVTVEELRTEVADLKHALHAASVEFHLLEERFEAGTKDRGESVTLKRKLADLERAQEQVIADLRALRAHADQVNTLLSQYRDRIEELGGAKKTYRVKSGDSLEKIAREHRLTVERLKEINHLASDRIRPGQELKVHE